MEYERVRPDYIIVPAPACQTLLHHPLLASSISSTSIHSHARSLSRSRRPTLVAKGIHSDRARVMGDDGGATKTAAAATTTGMKQITRLRELLHKWQTMAMGVGAKEQEQQRGEDDDVEVVASAIPPFVMRRLQRAETVESMLSDDEGSLNSPEPPPDVPRGYCPVYVGPEQRRFVIPTSYLAHPVFRLLLDKAEEEFGFRHEGALEIPCETEAFKYILQCVQRHDNGLAADANHPDMALKQEAAAMHHA
ncbi:hypothetical protein HU200_002281 [Digitaria exilis]|uniref:Small auxin up regulated protein n=1 Tax=Digitaria exilis TaxID=1010633 RepID=A0A835KVN7_9POAL|nr:hypothetical protein HU200_002281 [Digitaria exilis]